MALMAAFGAIVSGWEAYAQHLRGAYANRLMWTPVWLTPAMVVSAVAALFSRAAARRVLPLVSVVSILDGVVGFGMHLRGIGRMPGGLRRGSRTYNMVMGPPVLAPLLTCTVGTMGLLAGFLRRERLPRSPAVGTIWLEALLQVVSMPTHRGLGHRVSHGRFQRILALVSAAFAVLAGGEAYVEHLRGSFNRAVMWTPVWLTPPMVLAGVGAALSERVARRVLPWVAAVTFLDGMLGFALHLQGIQRMPGGFRNLQFNFTMGPPLFAPLLFSSVGLLGFLASLLRRGR